MRACFILMGTQQLRLCAIVPWLYGQHDAETADKTTHRGDGAATSVFNTKHMFLKPVNICHCLILKSRQCKMPVNKEWLLQSFLGSHSLSTIYYCCGKLPFSHTLTYIICHSVMFSSKYSVKGDFMLWLCYWHYVLRTPFPCITHPLNRGFALFWLVFVLVAQLPRLHFTKFIHSFSRRCTWIWFLVSLNPVSDFILHPWGTLLCMHQYGL